MIRDLETPRERVSTGVLIYVGRLVTRRFLVHPELEEISRCGAEMPEQQMRETPG